MPDAATVVGCRGAAGKEAEGVAAFQGGKAGVEAVGDAGRLQDGNWQGAQVPVQGLRQAERVPVAGQVAMGDLTRGMDTGIGAACGGDRMQPRLQLAECRFNCGLHRGLACGLTLPALERAAVIVDFQGVAWHLAGLTQAWRKCNCPCLWAGLVPILGRKRRGGRVFGRF